MQIAEIRFITVHDDFELSPNIVPVSLSSNAAARKQIKFRNKWFVISLVAFHQHAILPNVKATCRKPSRGPNN